MDQLDVDAPVDVVIDHILSTYRTFAVIGASPDAGRPSHGVMGVLERHGYDVVPVNPHAANVRQHTAYPDLGSVPVGVDVVDIFRRSEAAGRHVDEAIEIGARAVWMQLGVIDEDAAVRAREAGLFVVMDRCPAIELGQRGGRPSGPDAERSTG